jgi:cytochrome c-type biogenesis protein CcmH/NrfF
LPAYRKLLNPRRIPRVRRNNQRFLRSTNMKLVAAFVLSISFIVAQDPTAIMTPQVARVGSRLACRCGGCRNTVGDCPMIRCHSAEPMRHRILDMQAAGKTDDQIIQTIVQEEGIVALASPPTSGWGLFTWIMPGIALLLGFWVYTTWIRHNRKPAVAPTQADTAVLDRFRDQINRELGESDLDIGDKNDLRPSSTQPKQK